jgi:basic amino acid/polyamine antiporter, APA family
LTDAFGGGLDIYGVLQSAGLLFFAFAGYARIATMGEEVRDPQHTIPKSSCARVRPNTPCIRSVRTPRAIDTGATTTRASETGSEHQPAQ